MKIFLKAAMLFCSQDMTGKGFLIEKYGTKALFNRKIWHKSTC